MAPLTKTMAPNVPAAPATASRPRSEPASNALRALPSFARSVLLSAPSPKSTLDAAPAFDGSLASRYPAIARLIPAEVLAQRASGAVNVLLFLMLRPDAVFTERSSWEDLLANRRTNGSDFEAAQMIHNEALRRYFSGRLTPNDLVRIEVQPPLVPGGHAELTFSLLGTALYTSDGLFGLRELSSFGPVSDIDQQLKRDVHYVELTAALLNELEDLESVAHGPLREVSQNPEDFALNDVLRIEGRVHIAMQLVVGWQCQTGPPLAQATTLIARYNKVLGIAHRTSEFAKTWHNDEENTMESAGQANERRGSSGHWYSAAGWAFVEGLEVVGTFGNHNTRTKIAEAYQRGDISWNEAKHLVNSSARRTILAAAVASTLGPALGRFGAAFSAGAEIGTTGARAIGAFGGTITSAASLGSETLMTKLGPGGFNSTGQSIWDAGSPDAKTWALGLILGGAFGAAEVRGKPADAPTPQSTPPPEQKSAIVQGSQTDGTVISGANGMANRTGHRLTTLGQGNLVGVEEVSVVAHANPRTININGNRLTAKQFAQELVDSGFQGGTVRLVACKTAGCVPGGGSFAQELSQELSNLGADSAVIGSSSSVGVHGAGSTSRGLPTVFSGTVPNRTLLPSGEGWKIFVE